jgi:RNA polymerase sigma-70 factor, ECF subfamily
MHSKWVNGNQQEEHVNWSARDDEAIRQCQDGEIRGLAQLAERHQTAALRLAFLLTGSAEVAQDIVQDSFIQAYRRITQFRVGAPFAPWFHRIVMNMAHQHTRSPRYRHERSLQAWLAADERAGDVPDSTPSPETLAEQGETRRAVLAALAEITPRGREIIVLRYYLGYADGEIAELLGIPVNTARQRLHAARHALQGVIQARYPWLIETGWALPHTPSVVVEEQ